ncbi:MAG: YjgP/YjgQ family permease [Saprospiraceae bacterium]|nr:YjgP/YjgQ family permease [Saprospiraceae bacterium]
MKKIDKFVISSFIPPFIVAFSIAMFVLLMQILWLYIDDIAGKGLGPFMIIELLIYRSMSLVPMALPLGILIASVMVMGNMAEHYEISSMKSAGISLIRIMRSLLIFGCFAVLFSVYTSNTLIPHANLKFGSRMFDIQQKKPALSLETGTFNDDFQGYAIHIGRKGANGRDVFDVLIYDQTKINTGELTTITARSGEMFSTSDGGVFIMKLRDGFQYAEQRRRAHHNRNSYPFVRTHFETWEKMFDLDEFALDRTNPDLFKENRQMLSARELGIAADSIGHKIQEREMELSNYVSNYITGEELDTTILKPKVQDVSADSFNIPGSIDMDEESIETRRQVLKQNKIAAGRGSGGQEVGRFDLKPIEEYATFAETFRPIERDRLYRKVRTFARSILNQAESASRTLERMREQKVKYIYDQQMKYSMAVICMIFILIGAPMGAIVRKGGFGYPILVSIIFFMLFVILTIFCRKIAESFVLPAVAAAWLPCGILLPIGIVLTRKAMNDSKLGTSGRVGQLIKKWFDRKKEAPKEEKYAPEQAA